MKTFLKIILAIIVIFLLLFFTGSFYITRQNEYVAIVQFGRVTSCEDTPGLSLKVPFIQSDWHISKRIHHYDIDPSGVTTMDKKYFIADCYILWQVVDPLKYIQTLAADENRAKERVEAATYNALKTCLSSMTQDDMLKSRGETLSNLITTEANSDIGEYGVRVVQAQIKAIDLPQDNKKAVYERMISERNRITAAYKAEGESEARKIRNETDKDVQIMVAEANLSSDIIVADGEAEYMRLLKSAYDDKDKEDFYIFLRGLDSAKKSITGSNKTLIVDKNSEIGKILCQ